MGIKISEMTTTGSAPADSYIPLAHNGENYKVTASTVLNSANQIVTSSHAMALFENVEMKIADLQGADQVIFSATVRNDHVGFGSPWSLNGSYGRSDSGGTNFGVVIIGGAGGNAAGGGGAGVYPLAEGSDGRFYSSSHLSLDIGCNGDEVYVRVIRSSSEAFTMYWSYLNL